MGVGNTRNVIFTFPGHFYQFKVNREGVYLKATVSNLSPTIYPDLLPQSLLLVIYLNVSFLCLVLKGVTGKPQRYLSSSVPR